MRITVLMRRRSGRSTAKLGYGPPAALGVQKRRVRCLPTARLTEAFAQGVVGEPHGKCGGDGSCRERLMGGRGGVPVSCRRSSWGVSSSELSAASILFTWPHRIFRTLSPEARSSKFGPTSSHPLSASTVPRPPQPKSPEAGPPLLRAGKRRRRPAAAHVS